jgi:mannose-6-phosphate isomerase-like protein (cupin superfamily)
MYAFELAQIGERRQAAGRAYLELLRAPALSLGPYELPAGGIGPQKPHTEDEVYVVTRGRATVTVADEEQAVVPGSVIYVAAGVPHRFRSIAEALALLVFFAPAVYSQAKG